MTLSWTTITCGTSYQVYQLDTAYEEEGKLIGTTTGLELSFEEDLCSEHKYGVVVVVGGNATKIVQAKDTMPESHNSISGFGIKASAEMSWNNGECNTSYRIRVC